MSHQDLEMILRVTVAFILGGIIGFERESINQPAGLRTHMLVSAGSACFVMGRWACPTISGFPDACRAARDPVRPAHR